MIRVTLFTVAFAGLLPLASAQDLRLVQGFDFGPDLAVAKGRPILVGATPPNSSSGDRRVLIWEGEGPLRRGPSLGKGNVFAVSANGRFYVGYGPAGGFKAALASRTLPLLSNIGPTDLSADGSVVVGTTGPVGAEHAARWTGTGPVQDLGVLPGATFSYAAAVSADGSTVVGESGGIGAFRWTAETGMQLIADGFAVAVSGDGTVVTGYSYNPEFRAWRWTPTGGKEILSDRALVPTAISADGRYIGGEYLDEYSPNIPSRPGFLWDAKNGVRKLQDVLKNDFGVPVAGYRIEKPTAISANGDIIVGTGAAFDFKGVYIARRKGSLPAPPPAAKFATQTYRANRPITVRVNTINASMVTVTVAGVTKHRRVRGRGGIAALTFPVSRRDTELARAVVTGPSGSVRPRVLLSRVR